MRTMASGRAAVADLRSKITAADYAIMARVSAASRPGPAFAWAMNPAVVVRLPVQIEESAERGRP